MNEPIVDTLFTFAIYAFAFAFVFGWVILLGVMLLQWVLPKYEDGLEDFLQRVSKPLSILQKYSLWAIGILLAIRLLSGWLGWTEPLDI